MELNKDKKINSQKYLLVLLFTILIFSSGFFLNNQFNKKRMVNIGSLQQDLRIDILSLETQFAILEQAPCENLNESTLTKELYDISQKLTSVGNNVGADHPDYLQLKKYYSILEIKHWLLLQTAAKQCDLPLAFVIYFYTDKENCPKCEDQGYILTHFRKKYPFLRVYSFDYDLDLAALSTLKSIYSLKKELPIIVINNEVHYGYKTKQDLEQTLEEFIDLATLQQEATSTNATSTNIK